MQAWTKAFTEACASATPSKVVIPKGTFKVVQVKFEGPCKAPSIDMQIDATITAPQDPAQLKGSESWITFSKIDGLTVSGSAIFDGQGANAWTKNDCTKNKNCKLTSMNFSFNFLKNAMIKGITTKDSKNFHVNVLGCTNITFSQFTVIAPDESPNTDGIHIGRSNGVNILDCKIGTGDDCISIGDGAKQVKIKGVTCGPGHGISVGSLGKYDYEEPVEGLFITNCTLKGTDNGVRIKTWPNSPKAGTATDMHFEDIIMDNVKNPVLVDQEYCPWNQCDKSKPSTIKLSKMSFKNIKGTSATPLSVTIACSKGVPCEGVEIGNIDLKFNGGPSRSVCDNVTPAIAGKNNPVICAEKGSAEAAAAAAAAEVRGAVPVNAGQQPAKKA